jgi:HD-GYP domain-containing protein (c-di-GMP phosphodiesterase class II)
MSRKPLDSTVIALANTVAAKDPYMLNHQHRVAEIGCAIADKMGCGPQIIKGISKAHPLPEKGGFSLHR